MNKVWKQCHDTMMKLKFLSSTGDILENGRTGLCPLCNCDTIRFYCHLFDLKARRGSMWIWCRECNIWECASRIKFEIDFHDPFRDIKKDEFESMERHHWIDRLDQLVSSGEIPQLLASP